VALITKGLDTVEIFDFWYEDVLEVLADEAREKGIEIQTDRRNKPEISFSGFWSQGDGLAFDADVDWVKFFEAHPKIKEEHVDWYMLLSANPMDLGYSWRRHGRNSNSLIGGLEGGWGFGDDLVEYGFFTGERWDNVLENRDEKSFDADMLSAGEDEAHRMYKALEDEYEFQLEQERERLKEDLIEEYIDAIRAALHPLATSGYFGREAVESDVVDFRDMDELDLVVRCGDGWLLSKKGLKVVM